MQQTRTCPRCRHVNSGSNSFCASCGAGLKGGHAWKLLFGLFALVVGFVWGAALFNRQGTVRTEPLPAVQSLAGANATPVAQVTPSALTGAQHLAEARRALADGYKPNKDPKKASWGKVAAARWHLESIKTSDAEHADAQALLKEVAGREKSIGQAARAAAVQASPTPAPSAEDVESAEGDDEDSSAPASAVTRRQVEQPAAASSVERPGTAAASGGTSSSDYYTNVEGVRVRRPTFSSTVPEGASAQCRDGSYSFSRNRRGTCSHHGGVARWL